MAIYMTGVTTQTVAGDPLPIAYGGTGQATAESALNALLPAQTAATGQVLTSNGTTVSWTTVESGGGNAATVTNGVYTTDIGTVTNTMLAGSIANDKLVNSALTIGTTPVSLGGSTLSLAGLTSVTATSLTGTLAGNVTGNVTGNVSGTAATVTSAAQPAITSVGTLTSLAVTGNISSESVTTGTLTISGDTIFSSTPLITIDPSTTGSGGLVIIAGDLQVTGTTTTIDSTTITTAELNVTLAKNAVNAAAANGAGLTIAGAAATLTYTSVDDRWNLNKPLNVATVHGNVVGTSTNVTGTVATSNGGTGLTSPGTSGNILTSNGTSWVSALPPAGGLVPTSVKTSAYTALVNDLVRVDSGASAFTVTLPSAPADGDKVGLLDISNKCSLNAVLVGASGGRTVEFDATGLSANINGASFVLIYNSYNTNWKLM